MNTLKSVMVVGALAVVGYGVYAMLNNPAPSTPPWLGAQAPGPGAPATSGVPGAPPAPAMPSAIPGYPIPAGASPLAGGHPAPVPGHPAPSGAPAVASAYDRAGVAPIATGAPNPAVAGPLYGQPVGGMASTTPPAGTVTSRYGTPAVAGQPAGRYDVTPLGGAPVTPASVTPAPAPSFETTMTAARSQLNQGRLDPALLTLSTIYDDQRLSDQQQEELNELLDQVAGTVIYSKKFPVGPPHRVAPGETWATVAQKYGVPAGLLAKINGLDERTELSPNQELKVVRGPFQAFVNVPKRTLTLMVAGRYAGRFPISLGEEFKQIQGSYTINAKTLQHSRYDGQRYLELKPADGASTPPISLAIVGMADPTVAERGQAQGLIAVTPQNADDLYDILSQGSKVTIRR